MQALKPIDGFEQFNRLFDAEALRGRTLQPFAVNPPHPRLRDTGLHWFGEEWPLETLCYQRRWIRDMEIFSGKLRFQFETRRGFLVMFSSPSGAFSSFFVSIYYILGGFRGGDWGMLRGREEDRKLSWFKRTILRRSERPQIMAPEGPEPLESYRIEDDCRLDFKVRQLGWHRLTLFEEKPQRFLASNWRYEPVGSTLLNKRYFSVRRIYSWNSEG